MGACLGCLACNAASCVASGLCTCCGNAVSKSAAGRAVYCVVFLLTSVLAWIFRGWGKQLFDQLPPEVAFMKDICQQQECFGVMSVLRLSFALATFHLLHALIMIGVSKKGDVRAGWQDAYWPLKLIALVGLEIASFFIPNVFFQYYGWVALVCSAFFILVQLMLLVDFAHSWAENWIEKYEANEENTRWWWALLGVTVLGYAAVIAGTVCAYVFFAHNATACPRNTVFITVNLALCLVISLLAIHPKVQEVNSTSGLLQSAVVSGYCTYLIWSGLMSQPQDDQCNPFTTSNSTSSNVSVIIGAIFVSVAVCYSTMRAASSVSEGETSSLLSKEEEGEEVENADEPVSYSYFRFHLVFMLGAMYIGMLMSDWQVIESSAGSNTLQVDTGNPSVWIKTVSSWVCILLYAWTLVAPVMFPDREWK
eukprot:TRINITY_DN18282_c0_g1_i1.p1 TRINITY_DN18282_c0_g1~~TRINITY_DN18282_c0_g1_i1.p1  ORF type:complete len:423 (-),score=158.55 TRINITY_DN18282_c0_g1_i1:384-1652(-)